MYYIRVSDKFYPLTEAAIKAEYSNTSFPQPFYPPEGYAPVVAAPAPTCDFLLQKVVEVAPTLVPSGAWVQTWEVVPRFTEYTDEQGVIHTVAEQEAAAIAADQAQKAKALQDSIVAATQARLDDFARTRNYDGILSLCTYATSTVPKFQAEGQYGVDARDTTWAALYTIMSEVEAGTRPTPSGFQDIEQLLPTLAWPV